MPEGDPPHLAVLATGGTIAGASSSPEHRAYRPASLSAEVLFESVPEARTLARLSMETVAQVGSQSMAPPVWLTLARRAQALLEEGVDGILVIHGTDTMEETAFFLDQVLDFPQPVVVTGALRPATGISADGPRNILDSVRVGVSPEARRRGVLVVLDEKIHTARGVTKTTTAQVSTFQSPDLGAAGAIVATRAVFFRRSAARSPRGQVSLEGLEDLPRVDVLYACAGMQPDLVEASIERGARGLVLAGVGNGNAPRPVLDALAEAVRGGVPVVRSTRTLSGFVARGVEIDDDAAGFVASGSLNPAKSRVLLSLLLLETTSPVEIQKRFFER